MLFSHRRLCPDLSFFQQETEHPCSEILNQEPGFESLRKRIVSTSLKVESQSQTRLLTRSEYAYSNKTKTTTSYDDHEYQLLPDGHEAHWEVVERILFVYSKLNSGQSYVQGMNEIIGPIYYTFANDPNQQWRGSRKTTNQSNDLFVLFRFRTRRSGHVLLFYKSNDSYSR